MKGLSRTSWIVDGDYRVLGSRNGMRKWMREGAHMARRDPGGVANSIAALHTAESASCAVLADTLKAEGQKTVEVRAALQKSLEDGGFKPTEHLSEQRQGRIDLAMAAALAVLNVALSIFVFLGFGPVWLAPALGLVVLLTAAAVEEFFTAYDRHSVFGEAFFLTLSVVSLVAQFWIGSLRGLLVGALTPVDVGPVTHALSLAAPILRWGLGILAVVAEVLCGYKFYRARQQLCSASARGVRARDACDAELVNLHGAIRSAEAEPGLRRSYREIGAREYLSWSARADAERERRHLARAATGALLALTVLAMLLFGVASAFGSEPRQGRPVVVLIDLTKSTSPESFRANCQAVADVLRQLQSGDRVLVIGITDAFGHVPVLMDRTVAQAGYLGLQLHAAREMLRAEWLQIAATLEPTYSRTDVIGALRLLIGFMDISGGPMRLIILSDLRQSTSELDLESPSRIDVSRALAIVRRGGDLRRLKDADVLLLGVDPSTKSAVYMSTLKAFWTELFSAAGARVRAFSVLRQVPEFATK